MDITQKSTGYLIDEWITTTFKVEVNPTQENMNRMRALDTAIQKRLNGRQDDIYWQVVKLRVVLRQCWEAQEIVRDNEDIREPDRNDSVFTINKWIETAKAGIKAMTTNRERNKLIREIDDILGESEYTPLDKTY
jgi:hypothetical protein